MFFEKSINQRDWHQHAFHWVLKKRGPLKIARLFKKKFFLMCVTSCFNGVRPTGTHSLRQIISVISPSLLVFHIGPFDWTETKEKCSILKRAVSHMGVSTEFGKIKEKAVRSTLLMDFAVLPSLC